MKTTRTSCPYTATEKNKEKKDRKTTTKLKDKNNRKKIHYKNTIIRRARERRREKS